MGEVAPIEVSRVRVESPHGQAVEVMMTAVPLTSRQIANCQRRGMGGFLRATILEAVELAVASGADVIGLGGYTSIVSAAGRAVIEDTARVTTGNALTAACALDQLREVLQIREGGSRRIAVVGAVGNIGAVMAELLAPHADSMILLGSTGSEARLNRLRGQLGTDIPVTVSSDLSALADADVVVAATNSVDPIIVAGQLSAQRPVTVCDLAVPGDLDPVVGAAPNVTVISGGRMILPLGQHAQVPAAGLPPGVVFSCLAETILLGFEPGVASFSYGALTAENVERAGRLARRHDFRSLLVNNGQST
jgi:predicted amino acid dehydrogenase